MNSQNLPENVKEIKQQIGTAIAEQISNGNIQNRQDVVNTLENAGFEIIRQTERSISIKNPDGKRNIRLEGVIYENRQFDKQLAEEHSRAGQDYQRTSRERYETASESYTALLKTSNEQTKNILSSNLQIIQDHQPKIRNALRLNILKGTVLGVLISMFLIFLGVNFWLGKQIQAKNQELAELNSKIDQTPLQKQVLRKVKLVETEDKKAILIIANNSKKAEAFENTSDQMLLKLIK